MLFGSKLAPANPWNANTLEWTAPTPIPHGNWGPETPLVCRGPYDYAVTDGRDVHAPQSSQELVLPG